MTDQGLGQKRTNSSKSHQLIQHTDIEYGSHTPTSGWLDYISIFLQFSASLMPYKSIILYVIFTKIEVIHNSYNLEHF